MYIIYRELGLNRVFARLQVEEIWNCCRIRPPDRSHGLMVIVVRSEVSETSSNEKNKVKIMSFKLYFKDYKKVTRGVTVPNLTGPVSGFFRQLLSGFISVVTRVHTEPSPASLTGPGSVSCVCSGY